MFVVVSNKFIIEVWLVGVEVELLTLLAYLVRQIPVVQWVSALQECLCT